MPGKISLIGAGSAVFSLNIIRDICLTPNLQGFTINLMDINQERLDGAYRLCKRYAAEVGIQLDIETTTDRNASLSGADFVINTALTANYHRLEEGWAIGKKYGYTYGGSQHIMHDEAFWIDFYQLRMFEGLAEDILKICPNAVYFKIANPVFAATTMLARKYPELKFVGLCHGFGGVYHIIETLGLERSAVTFQIPGVNHFVWLNEFRYKGQNAFPILDRWIEEHESHPEDLVGELCPKKIDMYRRLGAYPIGDTGGEGGGSWPWWHHADQKTEEFYREDPTTWWNRYIQGGYTHNAEIQRITADESVRLSEIYPPKLSGEVVIPMLESIACDIPRVLIGNIINRGQLVPGVPEDIAVEIPLHISGRGIQGVQTTPLPVGVVSYLLRDYVAPINTLLEAYTKRSKKLLLELVMMDPWTRSRGQAEKFLDEILDLPAHTSMKAYFQ
jgi:alpha-galactosidase